MKNNSSIKFFSELLFNNFFSVIIIYFQFITSNLYPQDFQITETGTASFAPKISSDSLGDFVVVWTDYRHSFENGGTDTGSSIYGQLYSYKGNKLNNNFRISEEGMRGGNRIPSVSMNRKGDFVVVWHKSNEIFGDTDIYARIFNKSCLPLTQSLKVSDDTTHKAQIDAKVILREDNSFIIVWGDRREGLLFSYAQLFDSIGNHIGKNFKVNVNNIEDIANVTGFADGKFLFHWGEYIQTYNSDGTTYSDIINIGINGISYSKGRDTILILWGDPLTYEISGSFFDLNGNQIGQTSKINVDELHNPIGRWDAAFSGENYIIVWQDHRNDFPRTLGNGDIYLQRFNSWGEKIGENLKVNHEMKELTQRDPSVIFSNNNFVVTWLDIYPKCFPVGTSGIGVSHIMGTIQEFSNPISGEIFGWESLDDSCKDKEPLKSIIFKSYPNPFNTETYLSFIIDEDNFINLTVYNTLGEKIKVVINDYLSAKEYKIKFDATSLPSGIYIIIMTGINLLMSQKIVLIK